MKRALFITAAITLVLGMVLMLVGRGERWPAPESPPRQGEALDAGVREDEHAIHSRVALSRLVREPQNTWSNIAFVFCGAWLLSTSRRAVQLLGVTLIAVGIGSFLYHASASRTLRHLDVGAMYWLFIVTALFVTGSRGPRFRSGLDRHAVSIGVGTLALAIGATYARNFAFLGFKPLALTLVTTITAAVLTITLLIEAVHQRRAVVWGRVGVCLGLFAVAVVCQLGDRPGGWLCRPDSPIQAHSLWHVLSAAAFVFAVRVLD